MSNRYIRILSGGLIAAMVLFGPRPHQNNANQANRALDKNPQVSRLLRRACANCHSDNTEWPWYSHVRPVSWLLSHDVKQARKYLNLSRGTSLNADEKGAMYAMAAGRFMPPKRYLFLHPEAHLSPADIRLLARWADAESEEAKSAPFSGPAGTPKPMIP